MIRTCTLVAVCELALLATLIGLPTASADPAELCCGEDRSAECSGCQNGYLLGQGELWGCVQAGIINGCTTASVCCNSSYGLQPRYRNGTNCTTLQGWSMGFELWKNGCPGWVDCY